MFRLRFDLRVPPEAALTHAEQYREALAMARWADERGFAGVGLSEHHGTDDGFVHSPLSVAAAILGSTRNLTCSVAALLVPLHDAARLAEEIATVDLIGPGRLSVVCGLGYRAAEFDMFGVSMRTRGRDLEEAVQLMLAAWAGAEVPYRGRPVRVVPGPVTPGDRLLLIGGSVPAAARRAARLRLGYCPALNDDSLVDVYLAEAAAVGFDTPVALTRSGPGLVLVSDDPERLWARIGDQLLYDARAYLSWHEPGHRSSWRTPARDVADLQASENYAIVTPGQCVELARRHRQVSLHPLVAGIDPAIGWESLERVVTEVMPALAAG